MRTDWARRCLQLPEEFRRTWRLSADNCLVYGVSVMGGRKYYLPTGGVGYRVHGSNGWWSDRGPNAIFHNRLRSRALIGHYAKVAGMDDSCLELAKLEFRTKPAPSWKEARRYASLCLRGHAPWWTRLERAAGVLLARSRRAGRGAADGHSA